MHLPLIFKELRLPAIAAPMFLVSGTRLVIAACKSGIVGTMPALNLRTSEQFDLALTEIKSALRPGQVYGINLIVHKTNPRLQADLEICSKHQVPLIITSLGAVPELIAKVQSYGGVVFHDVANIRHAQKAATTNVDGLIAVCAGAGGHAGRTSPFALLGQIRSFFHKTVVLAGAISRGQDIFAAQAMGADLAYLGTRFIATQESEAADEYKAMIVNATSEDIVYTSAVSGIPANFLRASLEKAGFKDFTPQGELFQEPDLSSEAKRWKTIWSAGHGVGNIQDVPSVAELVNRLAVEYHQARSLLMRDSTSSGTNLCTQGT